MPRKGYEFPDRVKDEAIRRWRIKNPDRTDEELEVDHKVPVWFAKKHGVPREVITSQDNARAIPKSEHRDRDHYDEEEIKAFLSQLVNFIGRMFE